MADRLPTTPKREARGEPSGWGGTCGYCGWSGMPPDQVSCGRCGLWSGTEYEVRPATLQTTKWCRVPPEKASTAFSVQSESSGPLATARDEATNRLLRENLLSGEWVMLVRLVNGTEEVFVGPPADTDAKLSEAPHG